MTIKGVINKKELERKITEQAKSYGSAKKAIEELEYKIQVRTRIMYSEMAHPYRADSYSNPKEHYEEVIRIISKVIKKIKNGNKPFEPDPLWS